MSAPQRLDDARAAWELAATAPGYGAWAFRPELEARVADPAAHARVARAGRSGEGMMITSRASCSGCHQR